MKLARASLSRLFTDFALILRFRCTREFYNFFGLNLKIGVFMVFWVVSVNLFFLSYIFHLHASKLARVEREIVLNRVKLTLFVLSSFIFVDCIQEN